MRIIFLCLFLLVPSISFSQFRCPDSAGPGATSCKAKWTWTEKGVSITYEGDVKDGNADGVGKLFYEDLLVYEGDYKNGNSHGNGRQYRANLLLLELRDKNKKDPPSYDRNNKEHQELRYEGEYSEGVFHGKGVFIWKDTVRDFYDRPWGHTVSIYRKYEGQFVKGQREGAGTLYRTPGDRPEPLKEYAFDFDLNKTRVVASNVYAKEFVGEFKEGKKLRGKQLAGRFAGFDGDWQNDVPNGSGTWVYVEGELLRHNFGVSSYVPVMRIKPGYKYVGEVKSGQRHGNGVLFDDKGVVHSNGPWKENLDGNEQTIARKLVFPREEICSALIYRELTYSTTDKYGRSDYAKIERDMRADIGSDNKIRAGWIQQPGEHKYGPNTVYGYATLIRSSRGDEYLNVYCVLNRDGKPLGIEVESRR